MVAVCPVDGRGEGEHDPRRPVHREEGHQEGSGRRREASGRRDGDRQGQRDPHGGGNRAQAQERANDRRYDDHGPDQTQRTGLRACF